MTFFSILSMIFVVCLSVCWFFFFLKLRKLFSTEPVANSLTEAVAFDMFRMMKTKKLCLPGEFFLEMLEYFYGFMVSQFKVCYVNGTVALFRLNFSTEWKRANRTKSKKKRTHTKCGTLTRNG